MDPTSRAGTGLLLAAHSALMADDGLDIRQDRSFKGLGVPGYRSNLARILIDRKGPQDPFLESV